MCIKLKKAKKKVIKKISKRSREALYVLTNYKIIFYVNNIPILLYCVFQLHMMYMPIYLSFFHCYRGMSLSHILVIQTSMDSLPYLT